MKKYYIYILVAVFSVTILAINSSFTANNSSEEENNGSGGEENGNIQYEINRLKDPSTGKIPDNMRARELAFAKTLPNDLSFFAGSRTSSSALVWNERGPWNVGGRTRALAIDINNENNIIVGCVSGGIWRSIDQGVSWVQTTPLQQCTSVSCIAQDTRTSHTNVWYYGSGEAYGNSASASYAFYLGNGVYKSIDSGVTWSLLPSTTTTHSTLFSQWSQLNWTVATDPSDTLNDIVYTASYGAIYKSIDGGTTWSCITVPTSAAVSYYTDVAVTSTGIVYMTLSSEGSFHGIYRSSDRGATLTNITPAGFPTTYNRVKIGISPMDENQVYFLANSPGYGQSDTDFLGNIEYTSLWKYKYFSGNGIDSGCCLWQDFSHNLPATGTYFDHFLTQQSYDMAVRPKPNDTNTVFIGGTNLFRSTSGFADTLHTTHIGGYATHTTMPNFQVYLNHHPDQHEIVFYRSNPDKMLSSNDGGVFQCLDNTASTISWNPLNNGYLTSLFYACAIDHATTSDIIVGGTQDNGNWFVNSASVLTPWVRPFNGDGTFCAIADSSKDYFLSVQNGKIRKMRLNAAGGTDSFARIDPIGGHGYLFVNPFAIDPNNNNIMYLAGGKSLWRNDNLAAIPYANNYDSISTNWVRFPDSISTSGNQITAVAVSTIPANRVYFGTSGQKVFRIDGANTGTPAFTSITKSKFPGGGNVSCIAIDPLNADNLIVVFSNYGVLSLFYSNDGGATFSNIGGNLEANKRYGSGDGPSCRWATIMPVSDGYVYLVGTSVGLFGTTVLNDTFTVWTQLGTGSIGASIVNQMDYRITDGLVAVATHSHGVFSAHITQQAEVNFVKNINVANNVLDFKNYPNPFTNETTLSFIMKESANVVLDVYDMQGRLIQTLVNSNLETGEHKFVFNRKNLAPGVYFCCLNAGDYKETKSIIIR